VTIDRNDANAIQSSGSGDMNYKKAMSKEQAKTIRKQERQILNNGYIKEKGVDCYKKQLT
jgi:hypothetical protein